MKLKGWAITMGVGAAVGAVAVIMMPKNSPGRKLAAKAADKVEDTAMRVGSKFTSTMGM